LTDEANFNPAGAQRVVLPPMQAVAGVHAEVVSPYVAKLSWQPTSAATFDHYNAYCGTTQNFRIDQSSLVASPEKPGMVDWGLRAGQVYYYVITAVDRAGHEGPATAPVAITTASIKPVMIEKTAPSITFDAPEAGNYQVWLHLAQQPGSGSYVNVKMDNAANSWVGTGDGLSKTYWLSYDKWARFDLKAGSHTLVIDNKTSNKIDKVTITNDLSYRPKDDHVASLAGW
jgi:hypothetical protein